MLSYGFGLLRAGILLHQFRLVFLFRSLVLNAHNLFIFLFRFFLELKQELLHVTSALTDRPGLDDVLDFLQIPSINFHRLVELVFLLFCPVDLNLFVSLTL